MNTTFKLVLILDFYLLNFINGSTIDSGILDSLTSTKINNSTFTNCEKTSDCPAQMQCIDKLCVSYKEEAGKEEQNFVKTEKFTILLLLLTLIVGLSFIVISLVNRKILKKKNEDIMQRKNIIGIEFINNQGLYNFPIPIFFETNLN